MGPRLLRRRAPFTSFAAAELSGLREGRVRVRQIRRGAYLAYLTAFLTIAAVWINHHALFLRVRTVDPPTLVLNLGLLLGASLVPWPTALISASTRSGDRNDQTAATLVYALLTVVVAVPWTTLNLHLARRPDLLDSPTSSRWLRRNAALSAFSLALAAAAAGLALTAPVASLLLFLAAPLLLLITNLRSTSIRHPADSAPTHVTSTDFDPPLRETR